MKIYSKIVAVVISGMLLSSCSGVTSNIIETAKKQLSGDTTIAEEDVILFRTIEHNNYEGVIEAIDSGTNVAHFAKETVQATEYTSPLLLAMERHTENIIIYLLDNGADPSYIDHREMPLLFYTIGVPLGGVTSSVKDSRYTKLLLDYGADPNVRGKDGNNALDCAIIYGRIDDSHQKLLLGAEAKVTERTVAAQLKVIDEHSDEASDFTNSVFCDIVREVFGKATEKGIDIDCEEGLMSLITGDIESANTLIKNNKIKKNDVKKYLYFASAFGNVDTLKVLEQGYNSAFNTKDRDENIVSIAARYGNLDVMKYLLNKGYNIIGMGETWYSPLDYAVMNNRYDAVEYLLGQGAKLKVIATDDDDGDSDNTLGYAARDGEGKELVELIYNARADEINEPSLRDAMEEAIMYGNNEALEFLLGKSIERGYALQNGLLGFACFRDSILRNYGGCPNPRNDEAIESVEILLENGADVNGSTEKYSENYGEPLANAAECGETEIVKLLIDDNADVNAYAKDEYGTGAAPLTMAVKFGYFDIVKILIDNGALIDNKGEEFGESMNLMNLAKDAGSERIYEYLVSASKA
jgi:ankyrin repeat protein